MTEAFAISGLGLASVNENEVRQAHWLELVGIKRQLTV